MRVGRGRAVELVTSASDAGLGVGGGDTRYAVAVDTVARMVTVGGLADLATDATPIESLTWVDGPVPVGTEVRVQTSAHGATGWRRFTGVGLRWATPTRRVAPGQTVAFYDRADTSVLGAAVAT